MDDIRGNLKRRAVGSHTNGFRGPARPGGRYVPRHTSSQQPLGTSQNEEIARLKHRALNRAKRSPVRHKSVGLQSPIVLSSSFREIALEAKLKAKKFGKIALSQLKSIPKSPVKSIATGLVVLMIIPFALKISSNSSNTGVKGENTTISGDITPLVPKDGDDLRSSIVLDKEKGIASYQDSYLGAPLTISQQLKPQEVTPERLKEIAAMRSATQEFTTMFGKAYLATAEGENAIGQTVIFGTEDLLVFINASSKFTTDQWADYINSLR